MLKVLKALKALALGAALAPFLVGSAYAHEPHHAAGDGFLVYSAIVELGGGYLGTDAEDDAATEIDDEGFGVVEGAARASIPFGSHASVQFDLDGMLGLTEREEDDEENFLDSFFFASLHLTLRSSSIGALGILGSYGKASGGDDDDAEIWFGGLEGQVYLGPVTLYAQGGYMSADDADNTDVPTDAVWGRVAGRVFLGQNARLQAEGAYLGGEDQSPSSDSLVGWAWGGRFDHAPSGPVSYFVGYRGSTIRGEGSEGRLTDHTGLVGLALHLGADNLRDEDRRGATLDTPAWAMGRWTGWTIDVVD